MRVTPQLSGMHANMRPTPDREPHCISAFLQTAGEVSACEWACAVLQDGSRGGGGVHPMMRLIADAAPQRGEVAMRSGLPEEVVYGGSPPGSVGVISWL